MKLVVEAVCRRARRRPSVHAGACERFEAEGACSCGTSVWGGWGTKQELSRTEPFEKVHRSTTERTSRKDFRSRPFYDLSCWA